MNILERLNDARSLLMNLDLSVDQEAALDALLTDAAHEIKRQQALYVKIRRALTLIEADEVRCETTLEYGHILRALLAGDTSGELFESEAPE